MVLCTAADAPGPVSVGVCASDLAEDCCGVFSDTIEIKFCPGAAGTNDFYVYRLKNVPVCDMAYCAVGGSGATNGNNLDGFLYCIHRLGTKLPSHSEVMSWS